LGLFERLLQEREEEELRRGRALGQFYRLDSPALDRQMGDAPQHQRPGGSDGLGLLYHYIQKGPTNAATGMRFRSLKKSTWRSTSSLRPRPRGRESYCRGGLGPQLSEILIAVNRAGSRVPPEGSSLVNSLYCSQKRLIMPITYYRYSFFGLSKPIS
jgi:hypothetical protein